MSLKPFSAYGTLLAGLALGGVTMVATTHSNAPRPLADAPQTSVVRQTPRVEAPAPTLRAENAADVRLDDLAELRRLDASFANLAEAVSPAVVHIRAEGAQAQGEGDRTQMRMGGEGSGFIYRADGVIITNDHVVAGFDTVKVEMKDGRQFVGKVTRAEDSDIAIVRIPAKDLPTLKLADSANVRPGEFAVAVGAPLGLDNTVTIGHVSAIGRQTAVPDTSLAVGGRNYPTLIQTDAAINPGNSGGPLLDVNGEVIGVNTVIYSMNGGSNGIGFAIPSAQVRLVADLLLRDGKLTRSYLGVLPEDVKEYRRKELGITGGALVADVPNDGPAAEAGIQKDDVILRIGQSPVNSGIDLRNAMLRYAPGTTVPVEILRGKDRKTVNVKLTKPKALVAQKSEGTTGMPRGLQMPKGLDGDTLDSLRQQMEDMMRGRNGDGRGGAVPNASDEESDVPPVREGGKAQLGVTVLDAKDGRKGAVVGSVEPGSVAARAGMREGDVVESFDGKPLASGADLVKAMTGVKWGETHRVRFVRKSGDNTTTVERTVRFR